MTQDSWYDSPNENGNNTIFKPIRLLSNGNTEGLSLWSVLRLEGSWTPFLSQAPAQCPSLSVVRSRYTYRIRGTHRTLLFHVKPGRQSRDPGQRKVQIASITTPVETFDAIGAITLRGIHKPAVPSGKDAKNATSLE